MRYTWSAYFSDFDQNNLLLLWYYRFLLHSNFLPLHSATPVSLSCLMLLTNTKAQVAPLQKPKLSIKFSSYLVSNVLLPEFKAVKQRDFSVDFKKNPKFFTLRQTLYQTLNLFFLINQNSDSQQFKPHANFRLFYLQHVADREFVFKPGVFIRKWQNIYAFLYNTFYYNHNPLVFGSKFFKKETLSLNWFFNPLAIKTWRYTSFFFTFLITIYSRKLAFFYKNLKHRGIAFALIVDLEYHFKTLFYLKRNNWFTLALVPLNLNPWAVSFAVPVGSNDLFVQFFFFKFLVRVRKESLNSQFEMFKNLWFNYKVGLRNP